MKNLLARINPGPLVVALHVWTFGTGLIDAISFLRFDHVFVANMTGNVVFTGLALAGAEGVAMGTVAAAVGGFVVGAFGTGRLLLTRLATGSGQIAGAVLVQVALALLALGASLLDAPVAVPLMAGLLGAAMGTQNTVARHLKVPDATTTVVTMTVTGLAADRHQKPRNLARRAVAVTALLCGAACGALALRVSTPAALVAVVLVNGAAALIALRDRQA